jgi:hypothetical protein
MSSISLGSPIPTPNTPQDTNEAQAFTILGTLDPETRETKEVPTSPSATPDPTLRVMKITSKRWSRAQAVEGEQSVLQWLSEVAGGGEQQRAKHEIPGLNFLQKMTTSFENQELTFVVLVRAEFP